MNDKCTICNSVELSNLYKVDNLPLFQNKVYNSCKNAMVQKVIGLELCQCSNCGFVFNKSFIDDDMNYDETYQNEQNYSQYFIEYLNSIVDYLIENDFKDKRIVEIGCGKGFFTELLEKRGFSKVNGFDPAYEGDNPNITKDYFGEKYKSTNADLIILRHVLEHIEAPYNFLKYIQKATSTNTKILIEVPDFEWIVNNEAFWDIFYEHCNYFDTSFLSSFFNKMNIKKTFGNQYLLMLADLDGLKKPYSNIRYSKNMFLKSINSIKSFLSNNNNNALIVWGAASKGVTLLNIFDKEKINVDFCIDINLKKQNKYIATTGHKIVAPDFLELDTKKEYSIIIANQNYYNEIIQQYSKCNRKFYTLEQITKEIND